MSQHQQIIFLGDWGSAGNSAGQPECSVWERAIGEQIGVYPSSVPVVSTGDTFYTEPAAGENSSKWFSDRLRAAAACIGPSAANRRDWRFVPGNHDEEGAVCADWLPRIIRAGDDWAAAATAPGGAGVSWSFHQLHGIMLVLIDTNCIINAWALEHASDANVKAQAHATRSRDPPCPSDRDGLAQRRDDQAAEVGAAVRAWRAANPTSAVVVVGHHPLLRKPHDKKDKKQHEVLAMREWWATRARLAGHVSVYVCGHEHNLQVVEPSPFDEFGGGGWPLCVVSGAGGGNDRLDVPVPDVPEWDKLSHPAFEEASHGFAVLTVEVATGRIVSLHMAAIPDPTGPRRETVFVGSKVVPALAPVGPPDQHRSDPARGSLAPHWRHEATPRGNTGRGDQAPSHPRSRWL